MSLPESTPPSSDAASDSSSDKVTSIGLDDRILGDFRLLRRLGRGGMAEVYLAEQTSLKRQVAIKLMRSELLSDEKSLARFKREALAAAGLNHPKIVQVYTVGEAEGVQFIAQEYVQGMNLRDFIAKKGPPETSVAVHIIRQVAQALQSAHEAGVVHRDIKPENIMLTRRGEVKVADFGLAQVMERTDGMNLTQEGTTMGTPLYMSPEQVNGKKLDPRSDLYSLGVTCYHMLSGRPPFRGETALSIAVQHLQNEPEPLAAIRPDLPPALCDVVRKLLAKDREQRYPDAKTLLNDLKLVTRQMNAGLETGNLPVPEFSLSEGDVLDVRDEANDIAPTFWNVAQWKIFVVACVAIGLFAALIGWLFRPENPLNAPLP
ncbi:MAG: serine/threonine-protein kinase [Planctomycetota bacterium]|nr:serine/threonine-protein kinase [Planctomycetota bacterium]